ncbi:unnamed protein product [Ceratitis capitata]|uniref:(Mediterranean fruit fly) hypothetical protein n=1 Tax=Ceratitis capitata TaxID=7213 RepID=A0A811U790_CERCA|nr:unnamed protein product [Ceratitis capitata]
MKLLMATKLLAAIAVIIALAAARVGNPATSAIATAGEKVTKLSAQHCNSSRVTNPTQWMWGDVNPNIYYICDESSNATRQLHCLAGRGFFNGRGHYGCLPYEKWPACLDANGSSNSRSNKSSNASTADLCTDVGYLHETWPAVDPNKFHMCQQANTTPLLLNCESGKGYVSAWLGGAREAAGKGHGGHEGTHIVGCATWEKWRMYMHCEDYY